MKPPAWSRGQAVIRRPVRSESRAAKTRTSTKAPAHAFALGVLWHPEEDEASRVIGALVEQAR